MEKTIVAIQGNTNIGKTATIKKFRDVLLNSHPGFNEPLFVGGKDIKAIIEITHKGKKIKIGIESEGDPKSRLIDEELEDFILENCDIIICACRIKGDTIKVVRRVANKNKYNLIFTSNYISSSNQDTLNTLMAQHLLSLVETIAI